jgi:hypothetical protein
MTVKEIREAVITKLQANSGVQAVFGANPCRVYNDAPLVGAYPFAEVRILSDAPLDILSRAGNNTTLSIDIYGKSTDGDDGVEDGSDAIKAALHKQTLTVTGQAPFYMVYEFGGYVGGSDSQHFSSRYRIMSKSS